MNLTPWTIFIVVIDIFDDKSKVAHNDDKRIGNKYCIE